VKLSSKTSFVDFLYIYFAWAFIIVWKKLPIVGAKIQISEVIFIPLAFISLFLFLRERKIYKILFIDKLLLVFSAVFIIICVINGILDTYLEVFGVIYFLSIYFIFNLFYDEIDITKLKRYLYGTVFIISLTGIFGVILTQVGVETFWAWSKNSPFPYFQGFGRARGLSGHPNNLMVIIAISWIFMIMDDFGNKFRGRKIIYFIVTGIAAFLTFSKMGLLLIAGILFLYINILKNIYIKWVLRLLLLVLVILYLTITHLGIYNSNSINYKQLLESGLVSDHEVYKISEKFSIFENNYMLTKRAGIIFGLENQPFGIGSGQFVKKFEYFKERGLYTKYMEAFEPHSLYTGFWVENGTVGLLSLLILFFLLWKYFEKNKPALNDFNGYNYLSCTSILFIYLVDGFVTDVFFLRYYFLIFVITTVIIRKQIIVRNI